MIPCYATASEKKEVTRLHELEHQFRRPLFVQWLKTQGSLCMDQARKLKELIPLRYRALIDDVVERNRAELREELEAFHGQLKHGVHAGRGLLGRVAEFLVGQREL